jgi:hypothetical protein
MKQAKAMAASWARSFLAAMITVYIAGVTDPKAILMGGVAAIAPVALRFLNKADNSFGVVKE